MNLTRAERSSYRSGSWLFPRSGYHWVKGHAFLLVAEGPCRCRCGWMGKDQWTRREARQAYRLHLSQLSATEG